MTAENYIARMQLERYKTFKAQDPANFDVTFEVGEKLIYANKYFFESISTTSKSMLSERWKSQDEVIKLGLYNYDNFKEFLTFIYSGQCELSPENISTMVDIAEFYNVTVFKDFCDDYVSKMEIDVDNVFERMDLVTKYFLEKSKVAIDKFIAANFPMVVQSDKFMALEKSSIESFIALHRGLGQEEALFEGIYKWCERQALDKQTADPNLILNHTIKSEIATFLPLISFDKMETKFLLEFVAYRGFIFSSYAELSKILSDRFSQQYLQPRVKVTNVYGQTLHGTIIPDKDVVKIIKSFNLLTCTSGYDSWCCWNTKCKNIPSTPSPLKKKPGVEWYLVYFHDGDIGITQNLNVCNSHYLLAELTSGASGFDDPKNCKIEIE